MARQATRARRLDRGGNRPANLERQQPESDWDQGYGYQFWRCRHGAYRGDGAFGQYCIVLPEQDTVVAITSGAKEMQPIMDLVWDKLLSAIQSSPLPADAAGQQKLQQKLAGLSVPLPENNSGPAQIPGKQYTFSANALKLDAITLERDAADGPVTLVIRIGGAEQRIVCGRGKWHAGQVAWGAMPLQPAATAGGWTNDTFTAKICFYETPFIVTLRCQPSGDQLTFNAETNVGFGGPSRSELVGKVA